MNYDFECRDCDWVGHRYANLKKCPKCGGKAHRMITVEQSQADEIKRLQDENADLKACLDARREEILEIGTENERLRGVVSHHQALLKMGWELSTWAASINWDGRKNTRDWLNGLREHIERFQVEYKALKESKA